MSGPMNIEISVRVDRRPWSNYFDLYILEIRNGVVVTNAVNISLADVTPGAEVSPVLSLTQTDMQSLMDQLWSCGVRPTEGQGSAGAMAAVQEHLKDLRRLIFEKGAGESIVRSWRGDTVSAETVQTEA